MADIPPDRVNEVGPRDTRREPGSDALSHADIRVRGIYEISKALTAPARLEITLPMSRIYSHRLCKCVTEQSLYWTLKVIRRLPRVLATPIPPDQAHTPSYHGP